MAGSYPLKLKCPGTYVAKDGVFCFVVVYKMPPRELMTFEAAENSFFLPERKEF